LARGAGRSEHHNRLLPFSKACGSTTLIPCPPSPCGRRQVSPEALASLQAMGYKRQEAARALRFCGGDVAAAVNFIGQQRVKQQVRRREGVGAGVAWLGAANACHISAALPLPPSARPCRVLPPPSQERAGERRRQRAWLTERKAFGRTPGGVYVDREALEQLGTLGYERGLAAEALRGADNSLQARGGQGAGRLLAWQRRGPLTARGLRGGPAQLPCPLLPTLRHPPAPRPPPPPPQTRRRSTC
jgi:hypothetical protein